MDFREIIADILSTLTLVLGPILIIVIVVSPFITTKIYLKKFTLKRVIICFLISAILVVLVGIGLYYLIDYMFAKMGEAIFNSYN